MLFYCQVELVYHHAIVNLTVDGTLKQEHLIGVLLPFNGTVLIGSTPREGVGEYIQYKLNVNTGVY